MQRLPLKHASIALLMVLPLVVWADHSAHSPGAIGKSYSGSSSYYGRDGYADPHRHNHSVGPAPSMSGANAPITSRHQLVAPGQTGWHHSGSASTYGQDGYRSSPPHGSEHHPVTPQYGHGNNYGYPAYGSRAYRRNYGRRYGISGYGSGYGYGYGSGSANGSGYGYGHGSGSGYGYGHR